MKTVNRPARQVSRLVLHLLLILAFTLATFLITTPFTTERAFAATETQLIWQRLEELETLALNAGDNLDVAYKTPKNYFTINNKGDVYNTSQCLLSNVLQKNTAIRSLCTKNKGGVPSFSACFKDTHWCRDYGGKTSINGYECYAFANFAAWYLGAKDSSSVLSYSKIVYDKAFTKASFVNAGWRVGDVVRISRYENGKWLGHSVVLVHVHDNKITVLDANYWNSRYGYCRIMLHNITYNSAQRIAISRPKIYGANSNTYTIQYNANGGSGSMADTKVTYGVQHTLRANTFTRAGYTFKGWYGYRKSDGKWRYTDGTNSGWYAEGSQPSGYYKTLWEDQRTMGGKGSEVN
ncbi:MAG: InlB B-repeat-containing protein, partial [Firmicutes bacterium]|nr:InlB B-repeat-containing protein [Bacillota bacterium]